MPARMPSARRFVYLYICTIVQRDAAGAAGGGCTAPLV
jgi:hypothetical protein